MELLVFAAYSFFEDWDWAWLPLCIGAVVASFMIHNLFLMIARSFDIKELERYAKSEMMQAAATGIMAVALVTLVNSALLLSQGLISGELACGDQNMRIGMDDVGSTMDQAIDGIRCRVQSKAQEVASVHEQLSDNSGDFYSLNIMLGFFGITLFKGDWIGSLFRDTEQMRITNNLATTILIALNAQSYFLLYIKYNMLTIFLPVGILLRSFHFTRAVGALFIAVAIGFYFIFPIVFLLLDPGFVHIPLPDDPPFELPSNFCYPTMSSTANMVKAIETSGFDSTNNLGTDSVRDVLVESYVSLMLHPLISLFLTLVFVRYLMTVLGGDTYELMKMVSKVI